MMTKIGHISNRSINWPIYKTEAYVSPLRSVGLKRTYLVVFNNLVKRNAKSSTVFSNFYYSLLENLVSYSVFIFFNEAFPFPAQSGHRSGVIEGVKRGEKRCGDVKYRPGMFYAVVGIICLFN